ncbi:hypothetical protein H6G89_02270 [Oscillatoria sp. FACHB-1407]|uniref:hypothetical protein n=1 Tax=Oscillatoria sp. FACHB-1407 TaxID=2692847 RepID=UPI0016835284|nr:hypothetical protein [Oscillatoria sp. FACHB-1407]MBD2459859.1 hypothetical protein [Oscillatoria sp. FACHB-1407]
MADITCTIPTPTTPQELERAIEHYKTSDISGDELFCQWEAIRNAALQLQFPEPEGDRVPGADSY